MTISCYYGTRPEFHKIEPVYRALKGQADTELVCFGQHTELIRGMHFDRFIECDDHPVRLNGVVQSALNAGVLSSNTTAVVVQGDTASAFGIALAAFNADVPVVHIEAGMRTYDRASPWPEESYRRAISCFAVLHLCTTEPDADNLREEKICSHPIVVGSPALDDLEDLEATRDGSVLITLHRRENQPKMKRWFEAIAKASTLNQELRFIMPAHPSIRQFLDQRLSGVVSVLDPMNRQDFLKCLAACSFVITDSGGVQEEAAFLGKRVIVCRSTSERLSDRLHILCPVPEELSVAVHRVRAKEVCFDTRDFSYGDGRSGPRAASEILSWVRCSENFSPDSQNVRQPI